MAKKVRRKVRGCYAAVADLPYKNEPPRGSVNKVQAELHDHRAARSRRVKQVERANI